MALKIIFMGTPDFAIPALEAINRSNHEILEVYTQPPQKKNRGQKTNFSPVHVYCDQKNIEVKTPKNLNTEEEFNHIKKLKPDLVIVVAYGKILPSKILNIENLNFINIHASLLPKWRGAAPIQRAIMNSDKETGVSIMKIIPKLDAGPVMMQSKISLNIGDNFQDISKSLARLGAQMIIKSLDLLENKNASFLPQSEKDATYARKILKVEAKINWNETAHEVVSKINALNPNPGTWFKLNNFRVKVLKAIVTSGKGHPGEIIDDKLTVACSTNAIQILELKKEGKKSMNAIDFLRGSNIKIGSKLN